MPNKKRVKTFSKKAVTYLVALSTILWSLGLTFFFPQKAQATVTERYAADAMAFSGQKIKASSDYVALFGFGLTQDAGETLNLVMVQINNTTGITSSDFSGLRVYADTGSTDDAIDGTDTICGTQATVNVDSPTTIDTSGGGGCAIPVAAGNYDFIVAIKTSGTISNGDTFAYQVPGGPITYVLSSGSVSATGLSMPGIAADTVGPQVTGGGPPDRQIGAPVEVMVDRSFNEAPASGTVTTSTVSLKTNTGNALGGAPTGDNLCTSVTLNNTQVICSHAALSTEVYYTLTITTGVTDSAGNSLASNFTAQFKTGSFGGGMEFNPPPFVTGTYPSGGKDLPINGKIMINFSSAMKTSGQGSVLNQANVPLQELASNGTVTGSNLLWEANLSYSSDNKQLTISPPLTPPFPGAPVLTVGTRYRFRVRADNDADPGNNSCGGESNLPACVMNTYGLALTGKDYEIDFTVTDEDNTPPQVVGSYPDSEAVNVDRAIYDIAISFNEALNPSTATTSTVKLYQDNNSDGLIDGGDTLITGTTVVLDADGRVIHLSPNQILGEVKNFIINLTNGIKDIAGNALSTINRTFISGSYTNDEIPADTAKPTVMFASADNFSIAITFSEPLKFNILTNATESTSDGVNDVNNLSNWTIETSPDGTNWMTNPVTSGKQVKYEPYKKTLTIKGMTMPPGNSFKATASTNIQDLAGNGMASGSRIAQGTAQSAQNTGGMLGPGESAGPTNYFNMGTRPISVYPKSPLAGAATTYRVEFPADTAITASGKITLTFPTGFSFAASCATWPTDTFENSDINGQAPNTVLVASIVCDSVSRVVTITLGANGTNAGDMLRFEIQGIGNSPVPKDYSTSGYVVDIKTYNSSNALLESKTPIPFFINAPGSRTISGTVFNDNGAGGGTANNGTKDGSESGVEGIKVCLSGPSIGFQCVDSDIGGNFSFTQLNNGFYHLELPPISSGVYTGGPFFRDLNVSGSDLTGENFGLQQASAQNILDVYIEGTGLTGTKLDIFAFSTVGTMAMGPGGPAAGGYVMRECTMGTNCDAVQLPLTEGKWQVGVGPWMPKDPGAPPQPPDFTFMSPKPIEVEVTTSGVPDLCTTGNGAAKELCFTLTASSNQIKGKVVDGSGNAIQNVFVMARPTIFEGTGPMSAGASQTDSNGLFNTKVVTGSYIVEAYMPGMPPSNSFQCTVKDNTGASDNNSTADVYCNGVLIVNDVTGFSGSAITGTVTENDLIFKIAKSGTSVSGKVLDDSSNSIAFAHVEAMEVDGSGNPLGGWADSPTDNSGNYTLYLKGGTSTTPKNWKIRGFAPGFGELPSLTVAVVEGTNLTDKNLQATTADFSTVTGTVTSGGAGVQGAFINIRGANGGNSTVTNESGRYTLKVRNGSNYTIDGFVPGKGSTTVITGVTVPINPSADQNLTIAQAGTITVYVCTLDDPLSAPSATNNCASRTVTTAFVGARDSNGRGNGSGSNSTSGQYDLMVPAGTYTVFAGDPNIGPIGTQANVVVTANATTYVNIAPPAMYTVSGTVTSSDSACIEGTTVFLNEKTNGRMILSQVNSSGAWSVSNVPNGNYTIGAGKPGCVDASDPGTLAVSGANAAATQRTLTKADATISGSVTLSGSNVSFDTMVSATSGTGKMVVTMVDTSQTTGTNYTLNVTAGTWTVMARTDGYESSNSSVTVVSGGSASQNLTLTAIAGYSRKEPRPYNIKPSQGGIVKNSEISSDFEINIPAGVLGSSSNDGSVLTKETTAVVDTSTQDVLGNKGIEITPKDASGQPITTISSSDGSGVTITIPYDPTNLPAGSGEDDIVLAAWSDEKQQWAPLSTTCDTANNKCTATTTHFSTFAPIVATGGGVPSTPNGLSATAASSSQINLSWTQVSGATSYDIYRDTSAGGSFPRIGSEPTVGSGSTTTYSDTGLTASTTYYYKISALNASGESAVSSAVSATTSGGGGAVILAPTPAPAPAPAPAPEVTEEEAEEVVTEKPITEMTVAGLKAEIVRITALIAQLQDELAKLIGAPVLTLDVNLKYNDSGDDVELLQAWLVKDPEVYPEGLVTGWFGPLTKKAVIRFQKKYADEVLAPWGIIEGTGFVGSTTRDKLNALYSGQ